ncbi:MAG: hypothetical protein K9H64_01445 [Bacteroidales bacterium]|nr:hypothetical protein [Bacteroidales bacterium]MCF8454568.1 hypothetical protein [Bacteroidales bacterium]
MLYLKLILLAVILVAIAMSGMAIRMFFKKDATFSGGSCQSSPGLSEKGIGCGCGGESCNNG